MSSRPVVIAIALLLAAASARAQSSGEATPGEANASEEGGFVNSMREWARRHQIVERLNGQVNGWYPRLGGITRGSGFAGGPGIRGPAGPVFLDVSSAMSVKGYKAADVRARWIEAYDKRLELWTEFRYEDFPEEDFFGIGLTSPESARTSYDLDGSDIRTKAVLRPRSWARITAALGYMRPDVGEGTDASVPSIEQRFTDVDAPGLSGQPSFVHATLALDVDYRDTGGNTSSGGFYRATYGRWNDVTEDAFDFHRLDVELLQFAPISPGRAHVLSGRIGTSYVNNAAGHRVPFYFLAYVGGMDTIRSFREFRFEDENAIWMSVEYKWRPAPFLSVSAFGDAGEVRGDWEDIDFHGLRTGYGAGVGFHSGSQTLVRMDVGTGGGEGWQFFLKVRPAF